MSVDNHRYRRRMVYETGEKSQEFVETAATLTEALDRELKWVCHTKGRIVESVTIERE